MSNDNNYYWTQLMQEPKGLKGVYFKGHNFLTAKVQKQRHNTMIIVINYEDTSEPIVLLAFKKEKSNLLVLDYFESTIDASDFFNSVEDFALKNSIDKIIITKKLMTSVIENKLKKFNIEAVDNEKELTLETFYAVGLLGENKILINEELEHIEALKDELKSYPNSKRDFTVKAFIKAIEYALLSETNSISSSL